MSPLPDSLDGWLRYQSGLNPRQIDLGLDRLRPVAQRMALCADAIPVISVAGTNGKGSTVALLESLARSHGLSSASYTSPWLLRCNESVRINGEAVADEVLLAAFERVEAARAGVPLTEFEFRTLAGAHIAFAQRPDVVILEVGLGGRLDAVNIFDATIAVVSSIALDHQQWLGETRALIAHEKAGIARHGAAFISAESRSNELLAPLARAVGAVPWLAQRDYHFDVCAAQRSGRGSGDGTQRWWYRGNRVEFGSLPLPALDGRHQLANAAAAITALSLLGRVRLDLASTSAALLAVKLDGRLQRLAGAPLRFVDVAHNPQAAAALARWARRQGRAPLSALCAMYTDKDIHGTVHEMRDVVQSWHLAALPPPRGARAEALASVVRDAVGNTPVTVHDSIAQGWFAACRDASPDGYALGFGSFATVSAILRLESAADRIDT